jgi:hypothetical protein
MARDTHDREDLLAEATALVERVELALPDRSQHVTAGFRRDGGLAVFFGADPVYQFNPRGEFRRAFVSGRLYKAEQGRLVVLDRRREAEQVVLLRHELTDAEQADFMAAMRLRLSALAGELAAGQYSVIGQVPGTADVAGRVRAWLAAIPDEPHVANSARAGG